MAHPVQSCDSKVESKLTDHKLAVALLELNHSKQLVINSTLCLHVIS